jgi:Tfp pilus assembly protein PilZ
MIEQRKHLRIPFSAPLYGHLKFTAEIKDISINGCFLETTTSLAEGSVIDVEFTLPNTARMIRAKGEVRWTGRYTSDHRTDISRGVGIRFVDLSHGDIAIITEFIRDRTIQIRKFSRSHISIPILYSNEPQALNLEGEARDISLGGLFIRTEQILEIDEELHMEFSLTEEGEPVRCSGKVAYLNQHIPDIFKGIIYSGMGIEFMDITDDDLEKIDHALQNPL